MRIQILYLCSFTQPFFFLFVISYVFSRQKWLKGNVINMHWKKSPYRAFYFSFRWLWGTPKRSRRIIKSTRVYKHVYCVDLFGLSFSDIKMKKPFRVTCTHICYNKRIQNESNTKIITQYRVIRECFIFRYKFAPCLVMNRGALVIYPMER